MIWVFFAIAAPPLVGVAIFRATELSPFADALVKTVILFSMVVLAPLAAMAEIAPPFVTRLEVNWRNGNADRLFEGEVAWEDVPFLPPILNRIRSTTGKRRRQKDKEASTSTGAAKPSIA
ncbi:hypothetical protein [Rhizobium binxianense]